MDAYGIGLLACRLLGVVCVALGFVWLAVGVVFVMCAFISPVTAVLSTYGVWLAYGAVDFLSGIVLLLLGSRFAAFAAKNV